MGLIHAHWIDFLPKDIILISYYSFIQGKGFCHSKNIDYRIYTYNIFLMLSHDGSVILNFSPSIDHKIIQIIGEIFVVVLPIKLRKILRKKIYG